MHKDQNPIKETPIIHNYTATNLIPRHLGPEYMIHSDKLYSSWEPSIMQITLVVLEWFKHGSRNFLKNIDFIDHPFSYIIIMLVSFHIILINVLTYYMFIFTSYPMFQSMDIIWQF